MPNKRSPEVQKAIDEFMQRIDKLPDVDLTDPRVVAEIRSRLAEKIRPEIERINRFRAKCNGAGLFRVVY